MPAHSLARVGNASAGEKEAHQISQEDQTMVRANLFEALIRCGAQGARSTQAVFDGCLALIGP